MVGVWQGFWSLKGRVETDRFLFLDDGRWGWLATVKSDESGRYSLIQRSGRWEAREGVVELTELQRKEILGCKERSWPVRSCETSGDCEGCDGGYRIVHHDRPLVERISIGECPQNREAERLDNQYTCLSIGGRIFWRKAVPEKREQDRFIYGR
ncbi:MAG: hypothetical protein JXA30_00110 [Deltaproteobacteria bacterium]|nr:hypothetical protein [Deltaproteobacteria bacterium]